jgi:8-oxo-dGTP pyrophosphatase MutT (NUDIX family)
MNKKTIIAAGGLVFNEYHELLMMYRRGKWDLPKGKLDEGETIKACAVREVEEETGINNIEIGDLIAKTYHEYFDKWVGEQVIKETWWYAMQVNGKPACTPQTEEDIEQVIWATKAQIQEHLQNSYPNIIEIIKQYLPNIV